jgi:hypothetical protein
MKNMMLQVRNCKVLALCTLLLLAAGCKKDKDNEPSSISGNVSKPTWTVPADYDLSSSMTAIVKVDMTRAYTQEQLKAANYRITSDDLLAAFCGSTCIGIGTWKEDYNAYWLFIAAPESGDQVTLKYYSSALRNIFAADPVPYRNNTSLGSPSNPYTPQTWVVAK